MSSSPTVQRETITAWLDAGRTLDDIDRELAGVKSNVVV